MAFQPIAMYTKPRISMQLRVLPRVPILLSQSQSSCICRCHTSRLFSSSARLYRQKPEYKESFGTRLRRALSETKIKWYPIPIGLGIGFLGLLQFYRVNEREKARKQEEKPEEDGYVKIVGGDGDHGGRPKKRERIRPTGPWFVLHHCLNSP